MPIRAIQFQFQFNHFPENKPKEKCSDVMSAQLVSTRSVHQI
jgi:hypothetical protein